MGRAIGPYDFPGITSADALDANDQVGTILAISVPTDFRIDKAYLIDPSDQAAAAQVWLFKANPTLAASDAAFALADADLSKVIGVLTTGTYLDATNGQLAPLATLPMRCVCPTGVLYAALKTTGTPTYTTPAWPQLYMEIT
jgi:hypothetical protein